MDWLRTRILVLCGSQSVREMEEANAMLDGTPAVIRDNVVSHRTQLTAIRDGEPVDLVAMIGERSMDSEQRSYARVDATGSDPFLRSNQSVGVTRDMTTLDLTIQAHQAEIQQLTRWIDEKYREMADILRDSIQKQTECLEDDQYPHVVRKSLALTAEKSAAAQKENLEQEIMAYEVRRTHCRDAAMLLGAQRTRNLVNELAKNKCLSGTEESAAEMSAYNKRMSAIRDDELTKQGVMRRTEMHRQAEQNVDRLIAAMNEERAARIEVVVTDEDPLPSETAITQRSQPGQTRSGVMRSRSASTTQVSKVDQPVLVMEDL